MELSDNLNLQNLIRLFLSGLGMVTIVIVFAFMNFETKSSAEEKSQNIKSRQDDLEQSIRELRGELRNAQSETNSKLDKLIYFVKSK